MTVCVEANSEVNGYGQQCNTACMSTGIKELISNLEQDLKVTK